MNVINRAAIVVKPAKPFLDWLHQVDPTSKELSLEEIQEDPTVYLLPEAGDDAEARRCLAAVCGRDRDRGQPGTVDRTVGPWDRGQPDPSRVF